MIFHIIEEYSAFVERSYSPDTMVLPEDNESFDRFQWSVFILFNCISAHAGLYQPTEADWASFSRWEGGVDRPELK